MFLVTTSDESTWNPDGPKLFLGEWCRRFSRSNKWQSSENIVFPYHWDDRKKFSSDYEFLEKTYEKKLAALSVSLGNIHKVSTDIRYWRIIIGPWLRFFIDAVFDRFEMIRTVEESNLIDDTWIHTYQLDDWIASDFVEFYDQFRYDQWNHVIYSECILESKINYTIHDTKILRSKDSISFRGYLSKLYQFLLGHYGILIPSHFNRISIISAYVPLSKLWKLQRSLGQLPYLGSPSIRLRDKKPDHRKRDALVLNQESTLFDKLLNRLIKRLIPYTYIENFAKLKEKSLNQFPRNPRLIFTSNAYQGDDGFKIWAAHHAIKNVPLVIEQHGGHFGIGLHNQTEDHQLQIANVFASWGWKNRKYNNIRALPALKLSTKFNGYNKTGDILLITASYPRYFYCHFSVVVAGQTIQYLSQISSFCKKVDASLASFLRIRTDADIFGWEIHERLRADGVGWALDTMKINLNNRLKSCRIAVITYNATVFLETLAANFPTLIFFDADRYEIRQEAIPMMNNLRKVGILHDSPDSAASFLNSIKTVIDQWWNSEILQATRKEFCSEYALASADWIDQWAMFLKSIAKKA
jgi:putative transferase (TIGR04331 family)